MRALNTPQNVLMSLYYSLFHSHLSYGICLYGLADSQYTSKITLIQKRLFVLSPKLALMHIWDHFSKKLGILTFSNTLKSQLSLFMWQYDHGELPHCFNNYFKRVSSIHSHNTRAASSKKLSENILVNTTSYGKNMLKFIGPKIFNEIVTLDFYDRCSHVAGFKSNLKKYLLDSY